jgi:LysM repeat protein
METFTILRHLSLFLIIQSYLGKEMVEQRFGDSYIVQRGDTLRAIALRFCDSVRRWRQIQSFNNLVTTLIFPGDILVLPPACVRVDTALTAGTRGVETSGLETGVEGIVPSGLQAETRDIRANGPAIAIARAN